MFYGSVMRELWIRIEADLARARGMLPESTAGSTALQEFEHFLCHNELELACDMLQAYGEEHPVTPEFWLALRDAAIKMKLPELSSGLRAEQFSRLVSSDSARSRPGCIRPDLSRIRPCLRSQG